MSGKKMYWIPLESNPSMLTKFAHGLGASSQYGFSDVLGLDEELLAMIPDPCYAFLLLYPYEKMKPLRQKQEEEVLAKGQYVSPKLFFIKQLIGNACGTIAVLHALANNRSQVAEGSGFLTQYVEKTLNMTPEERGKQLEKEDSIEAISAEVAHSGQTETPAADDKVDYHFICFTIVDGHLYELDGAKKFPINHGPSTLESFKKDAAKVLQKNYIEINPDEMRFSVISLGPNVD
eukprot:TRINITY_DN2082_c0_g1_i2.p1 TRINITY_DN2082_c0_g1~~TRINITY_DN2082_c0_g1_i2.p1  ORF type:complete len:234 (-),score=41.33 TRINITY_DN2082_c0_g1_i2:93-794(-)